MKEKKFNYAAQNYDQSIELYVALPDINERAGFWQSEYDSKLIHSRAEDYVPDWRNRIVNLKTHHYKIVDGLLISESKRGGLRTGSGRKRIDEELKRKNVTVSLSNYAIEILNKNNNKSKFIEELILKSC